MNLSKLTRTIFLASACVLPAFSATLIVNSTSDVPSCPAEYATIQGAVNAAAPGQTIYVCAGTYNEQVIINKSLTIAGQTGAILIPSNMAANGTELVGGLPVAAAFLVTGASNVIISDMIVDGANNNLNVGCGTDLVGILYQNSGGTITHNAIRNFELSGSLLGCQVGLGIYAEAIDGTTKSLVINQNSIHDYQKDGIAIDTPTYGATVTSNIVRGFGPTGVIAQNGIEIDAVLPGSSLTGNNVSGDQYVCTPAICYGAAGFLVFSNNVSSTKNVVTAADYGIYYLADNATASSNAVSDLTYVGISLQDSGQDVASAITLNTITNSLYASVEFIGSSNNVSISSNTLIEAPFGIINDNSNVITATGNKYFDLVTPTQNGVPPAAGQKNHQSPKPSRLR